jgi:hypothetical protein
MRYITGTPNVTDGIGGIGVDPHKEKGGKRKGRSMKRQPKGSRQGYVTLENLKTARDNGGVYDKTLRCVVYNRKGE